MCFFYSFPSSSAELQKNVPNNQTGHFWQEWTLSLFFYEYIWVDKLPSQQITIKQVCRRASMEFVSEVHGGINPPYMEQVESGAG